MVTWLHFVLILSDFIKPKCIQLKILLLAKWQVSKTVHLFRISLIDCSYSSKSDHNYSSIRHFSIYSHVSWLKCGTVHMKEQKPISNVQLHLIVTVKFRLCKKNGAHSKAQKTNLFHLFIYLKLTVVVHRNSIFPQRIVRLGLKMSISARKRL